jgi:hypothetical protein
MLRAGCQARKKFLLKINGRVQVSQEISIPRADYGLAADRVPHADSAEPVDSISVRARPWSPLAGYATLAAPSSKGRLIR